MIKAKRYAIISDIHANIEALDAVINDAKSQNIDEFVCLGDVVGYNAAPHECIRRIRELGCKVIQGNHDYYCSDYSVNLEDFQPNAASVIEWTRRTITEEDTRWLRSLPLSQMHMGFTLVHSTLDAPKSFRYAFETYAAKDNFNLQRTNICFHGHTHVPCIFHRIDHEIVHKLSPTDGLLEKGHKYFINVGSVGQPRDGIPKACYVILTAEGASHYALEFRRVEYDIESAIQRIKAAGLPEKLVTRLETGI